MAAGFCPDNKKKVLKFDTEEDVAVALAKYVADLSDKFCKRRGIFTVVLSGGTLIDTMRKLLEPPYIDSIEWGKWHIFWLDERVVRKTSEDSNYKLAYDGFLSKVPIKPEYVYSINDTLSPEGAAEDYENRLKQSVNCKIIDASEGAGPCCFDLILLGMGPDGHVASLFPGHPLLKERNKWVTFITDSPKLPPRRITFTFPVINSAAYNALVVTGAEVADAVNKVLGKCSTHDPDEKLPAGRVTAEVELTWFLDKDAASMLDESENA